MSSRIQAVDAWQILDSRGNPTLEARITLENGAAGSFQAPSGASTGKHEAVELRDGPGGRYRGKSVLKAVEHVRTEIADALIGLPADDQALLDRTLIELDGTEQKSRLGANALLVASGAAARAASEHAGVPLWQYLTGDRPAAMPVPMVNILSGGLHAGRQLEFQDFLAVAHGFFSFAEAIEAITLTHRATQELLAEQGFELTGVADEGGFGPRLGSNRQALDLLLLAIERAGFEPGEQISIAIDVASTHFYRDGGYELRSEDRWLTEPAMIDLLADWVDAAPILSIEDGLSEDSWDGWKALTERVGDRCRLIGDDFFTTNPKRLARGIAEKAGNSVLVKMNQIGTLSETFEVIDRAREAGFSAVISARSGETEDSFLADLAIASGAGQIKVGSVTRSERLSKYNRLLSIEALTARTGEGPGGFEVSRRLLMR